VSKFLTAMLSVKVCYCNAECRYAQCRRAGRRGTDARVGCRRYGAADPSLHVSSPTFSVNGVLGPKKPIHRNKNGPSDSGKGERPQHRRSTTQLLKEREPGRKENNFSADCWCYRVEEH
jgi:hypothetical protein